MTSGSFPLSTGCDVMTFISSSGAKVVVIWTLLIILATVSQVSGIGCFVCHSINGSEPECEDTFNNTHRFYQEDCFAGRKGRSGLFPGTECIKLKAQHPQGYEILVRDCVVDNGDINEQSEIGRLDHCGFVDWITYNGVDMKGCILTCDSDGCNHGYVIMPCTTVILVILTVIALLRVIDS